ncbi:hypothetical protein SAMN05216257_101735 [Meinhardsimonia xiamenensis]|jgi:hypothetical protein|uniref:Uncharacterized protein n=1 Tax=Meinhardsimonia xiamenensis TaxID=990712 RepID=A0A1G8ZGY5_9RHOB|nr:hypothetical protein [Meinhardsimonia xiamenensis]PRX37709.1 hypothetical protein LV81_01490 [Meinhardsimonia xiamenensis]SDK14321.1 hypothetical protein SAMN05216257_101735 [Meinhardsimonia xiamenensis]
MEPTLTHDLYIVIGIVLGGFALSALLGALADRRRPWPALFALLVGAGLVGLAVSRQPEVYDLDGIAHAFIRVIAWARNQFG